MAHLVENMFSVKQTPWHGLGHVIENAPNFEKITNELLFEKE